jgi:hypothetical protein
MPFHKVRTSDGYLNSLCPYNIYFPDLLLPFERHITEGAVAFEGSWSTGKSACRNIFCLSNTQDIELV